MSKRQKLDIEYTITFHASSVWPDDYPFMTLEEAIAFERDETEVADIIEVGEPGRKVVFITQTELKDA